MKTSLTLVNTVHESDKHLMVGLIEGCSFIEAKKFWRTGRILCHDVRVNVGAIPPDHWTQDQKKVEAVLLVKFVTLWICYNSYVVQSLPRYMH